MVYFVIIVVALIGAFSASNGIFEKKNNALYSFLCLLNILVFGLRYRVGIDTLNYIDLYSSVPSIGSFSLLNIKGSTTAPLFLLLMSFCKSITNDFVLFQMIHSIVLNVTIFAFFKKTCDNPFVGFLLFFFFLGTYFNTEILKESYAICCFLWGYDAMMMKNWKKYYLFAILGMGFHYGALILFLIPMFMMLRFNKRFVFVSILFMLSISTLVPLVISSISHEGLQSRAMSYEGMLENGVLNINYVIMAIIKFVFAPLAILWYGRKLGDIVSEQHEALVCAFVLMGLGCVSYQVMFQRFSNYFFPFYIVCVANVIRCLSDYKRMVCLALILFVVVPYGYDYLKPTLIIRWFPYHSILDPQEETLREMMRNI